MYYVKSSLHGVPQPMRLFGDVWITELCSLEWKMSGREHMLKYKELSQRFLCLVQTKICWPLKVERVRLYLKLDSYLGRWTGLCYNLWLCCVWQRPSWKFAWQPEGSEPLKARLPQTLIIRLHLRQTVHTLPCNIPYVGLQVWAAYVLCCDLQCGLACTRCLNSHLLARTECTHTTYCVTAVVLELFNSVHSY
jgi:hypothetical protein